MKNKLLYIIILTLCLGINSVLAQNKISGKITNMQTKEALEGVSVYINDLKTGVSTDKTGDFEIPNLKTGNYLIEVSAIGYNSIINSYFIKSDTVLNFEMTTSHRELTEVVITGVNRSTELKQNPVIIKSIDKNYLNQSTATNLIDALKNVPGVSQITTGAAISKPVIRGMGYNRVISLLNGIKQEGQQWGDEHGIEIDEYAIDKIEIVKGPGSLMYGSDGIAGVLNFLSPKAPPAGKINTQFVSNYQSNNNLIGYSISNAGNRKGLQWLGRFSNKFASNFQNKYDGKVLNSGFREYNGSVFLGINKNWGHAHLYFDTYNAIINMPEGERDSSGHFVYEDERGNIVTATNAALNSYKIGFPHQSVNHLRFSLNNYFILKEGTLNFDIGYQNNKRREYGNIADPKEVELFFDLHTINYNARYNLEKVKGWETSFGLGGMLQNHKNRGVEYLIPNYNLMDFGVYSFTQKTFKNKWTLAGGLRLDSRIIQSKKLILDSLGAATNVEDSTTLQKFSAFGKNYLGFSGSVGLSYQITKTSTLKLNVSRGFRAPNIAELSSNGRHEGTFRYEIGNTNLKAEISHEIDLAYFLNTDHVSFELTPFVNFISNYIYAEKWKDSLGNDIIIDPSDPLPAFVFTQGKATLLGGEIYVDFHPHPLDWLHIANSFAYVQATQSHATDSTKYLPFIPAPKYRGELKAEFNKVGKIISNAFVKFGVDYYFAQKNIFSAYSTETPTNGYALISAGIGGSIKAFDKNDFFTILISAENLANVAYQNHLSRLKYAPINLATGRNGIYNQGRNISVKLLINL